MEDCLKVPNNMATHSYRKALSYLLFSILVLVSSIVIAVFFASAVSHQFKSQFSRHGAWMNYTVVTIFRKLDKGRNVPIRYLKHDPSVSWLEYEQISA